MSQYFLWLVPDGEAHDRLARLIEQLSKEYRGPRFEPHLTLLGGIEGEESVIFEQISRLAKKLHAFSIDLQDPAFEDEYFRCLYFSVKKTPELIEAHEQAKAILEKMPLQHFHPHVSLLYGVFPKRVKHDIIANFPTNLPQAFLACEIKLIRAESLNSHDWHVVETIPLQGLVD